MLVLALAVLLLSSSLLGVWKSNGGFVKALDPEAMWKTCKKLMVPLFGWFSSGLCSLLGSELTDGRSFSEAVLCLNLPF